MTNFNFALVLAVFFALPVGLRAEGFEIQEEAGKHIDVSFNGRGIIRLMTANDTSDEKRAHETYKVYAHVFDPLDEGNQRFLTKGAGDKFTHHRGIYIGWSKTKVAEMGTFDTWHMKNGVRQHFQKIVKEEKDADSATLTVAIDWVTNDQLLLTEERTFIVHKPAENGAFTLDKQSKITAVAADTELNGDPEHAGCQFRPNAEVVKNKSAKYLIAGGKDVKLDRDIPWAAETFLLGEQSYYVQHMSHPDLPKGNIYSAYRDYGRFGAFFKTSLKKDEARTFQIRFYISPGAFPENAAKVFDEKYAAWVGE